MNKISPLFDSGFGTNEYRLVPHRGAKTLVVFMTATRSGEFRPDYFNFWRSGHELPVHRLFVNAGPTNTYYQTGVPGLGDTIEETLETIRSFQASLGATETVFIGQSMGAYGAILFGALSGCRVLAFGPPTVLRLPASRSLRRMAAGTPHNYLDLRDLVANASAPIIAFCSQRDPVDVYCASLMSGENFTIRPLRHATHGVASYLNNRDRLIPLIEGFLDGEPVPLMPEDGRALDNPEFAARFYEMHVAYDGKDWELVTIIGNELLEGNAWCDHGYYLLGMANLKTRNIGAALRAFSVANTIVPSDKEYQFRIAQSYKMIGEYEHAIYLLRKLAVTYPEMPHPWIELANIYSRFDMNARATGAARKALSLKPNLPKMKNLLAVLKKRAKDEPRLNDNQALRIRQAYS